LLLLIIICIVLSGWDVTGFELSLRDELNILLDIVELAVQVVKQNSEFVVAGLLAGLVKSFYILLTDLYKLLIHLIVLLRNQLYDTHSSAYFLTDLVEIRSLTGSSSVSSFYVFLIQLTRREGILYISN
jgi:hypothetical protein